MIDVIDTFPPEKTVKYTNWFENDPEDVYFVQGCYKLGIPVGDDEESSHFAVHTIWKEEFFGIHQPDRYVQIPLLEKYPQVKISYLLTRTDDPTLYLPRPGIRYI
jgi:hypothetical protein